MLEKLLEEITEIAEQIKLENRLILYNDDIHSFDFVITSLMDVCGHTETQAEQCAMLAHIKGKCVIKSGLKQSLIPIQHELECRELIIELQ
ncbi:MAG: ATP-dependent Clp protease adaptor ClpS [Bacteroidales bacterium]|nr:ATP-dependent Clp protease adaptor ClpS [Bacteroidales bacterium]